MFQFFDHSTANPALSDEALKMALYLRDFTICLFANDVFKSGKATVVGRFAFILQSLSVAATISAMALTVSSDFCPRSFSEGYTLPTKNGCVYCQVWCLSMKKG